MIKVKENQIIEL